MLAATHVRTISARRIVSILIVTVRIRLRRSSKKQAAEKDEYADLLVRVVLRFGYLRVQNRSAWMNRGLIQVFVFVKEPLINYFVTVLRAQLRRDTARREGNGRSPCRGPQHSIGTTGAQPVDSLTTVVGPGRIARITTLQWLDRPKGMLSPSRLVLRTICLRRSREIIDQRFPDF